MASRQIFKLFSSCMITPGNQRALLTDTQRGCYYTIPLALYQLLLEKQDHSIEDVFSEFKEVETREILKEYFDWLLDNELIFICSEELRDCFPSMDNSFDLPAAIANAIIYLDEVNIASLSNILDQLAKLNCLAMELILNIIISDAQLNMILKLWNQSEIDEVNIIVPYNPELNHEVCFKKQGFPSSFTIYNAPVDKEFYDEGNGYKLSYSTKNIRDKMYCGVIKEKYFTPDLSHYTESLQHNTCLNRKISIDSEGNIRNCPSMKESFGNIKDTTLAEAIAKPGFKKYWNITKDQVAVCRDCEFRHVCTDCRAYLENPEDDYSKPLKCGYDPYTCTWEEWSTHPMKQQAIDFYGMRELVAGGS